MNKLRLILFSLVLLTAQVVAQTGQPATFNAVSPNCPIGCPSLTIEGNTVVFETLYTLSLNPTTKFADWVAYEVDVLNFGSSNSTRNWVNNPLVEEELTLEAKDYSHGYRDLGVDRGHQAPLASFIGARHWETLNYLSNITPQQAKLNRGAWLHLESAVRASVDFREPLYVITGTLYKSSQRALQEADEAHMIPSHYYKIVYNLKGESVAFLMSQDLKQDADYCEQAIDINHLRMDVGYSLPEGLEDSLDMYNKLGCGN